MHKWKCNTNHRMQSSSVGKCFIGDGALERVGLIVTVISNSCHWCRSSTSDGNCYPLLSWWNLGVINFSHLLHLRGGVSD
jgi:hypothetical protein